MYCHAPQGNVKSWGQLAALLSWDRTICMWAYCKAAAPLWQESDLLWSDHCEDAFSTGPFKWQAGLHMMPLRADAQV